MNPDDLFPQPSESRLLTRTEVARRLGVSVNLVHSFIVKGKLTVIYVPGNKRPQISEDELQKFIKKYGLPPYRL